MSIEAMKQALESAYLAGFYRSGEGYNSDYPFSNKGLDPLDDPYWIESRDAYVRTAIEQAEKPVAWLQIGLAPFHDGVVIARTTKPAAWNPEWWRFEPLYTAPLAVTTGKNKS